MEDGSTSRGTWGGGCPPALRLLGREAGFRECSAAVPFGGLLSVFLGGQSVTPPSLCQRLCGAVVSHTWLRLHGIQIPTLPALGRGAKERHSSPSKSQLSTQRMVSCCCYTYGHVFIVTELGS